MTSKRRPLKSSSRDTVSSDISPTNTRRSSINPSEVTSKPGSTQSSSNNNKGKHKIQWKSVNYANPASISTPGSASSSNNAQRKDSGKLPPNGNKKNGIINKPKFFKRSTSPMARTGFNDGPSVFNFDKPAEDVPLVHEPRPSYSLSNLFPRNMSFSVPIYNTSRNSSNTSLEIGDSGDTSISIDVATNAGGYSSSLYNETRNSIVELFDAGSGDHQNMILQEDNPHISWRKIEDCCSIQVSPTGNNSQGLLAVEVIAAAVKLRESLYV